MPADHEPQQAAPAGPLQVIVIRDPDDRPSTQEHLRRLNDPDHGVLVIRPLPFTSSPVDLTFSVLDALGKALPSAKTAALPSRPWDLAVSWTHAYRLRNLVVDRAHTVHPKLAGHLRDLLGPPGPHRARLWLIDAARARTRGSVLDGFGSPDCQVTVKNPGWLRAIQPTTSPGPHPGLPPIPDDLPADNFLTFRAACARHLDTDTMTRLDELWLRTFREAPRWVSIARYSGPGDPFHQPPAKLALPLSLKLAARIYIAASAGEALVQLRAAQAGLLREGLLLHHQSWPGDPGLGHRLTPAAVSAVNRVISTQDAAAAILYLLFPYDRRSAEQHWHPGDLTLGEISETAAFITIDGAALPIPAHARPALLAHLAFRRVQGATAPDAAFFEAGRPRRDPRLLADRALAGTTCATDLRGDDPGIPEKHGTLWMRQRRLTLCNLVGTAHTLNMMLRAPAWT